MGLWQAYKKVWTVPVEKVRGVFAGSEPEAVSVNPNSFPIEVVTSQNDLFAELTVPTQSDGATISQSGWQVGGDSIARTTSKGTVEEQSYEDAITRLRILESEVEMGVMLDDSHQALREAMNGENPNRTIRISMADITDVRREQVDGNPGFTFETEDDVYQIGLHLDNSALSDSSNFESAWIDTLVQRVEEESNERDDTVAE